jgi:hypothetical protein
MKLIFIFGPPAVGKMTVGQEIAKRTELKLFHNHMSIELIFQFFEFGTPQFKRLDTLIRTNFFHEIAHSDLEGMIFTFVWAQGLEKEDQYVDKLIAPFVAVGADIYYVELAADLDQRLIRNKDPHRLAHKASKRDLERSEKVLLYHEEKYRFNTHEGEFTRPNHLKIDNTHLSPAETAAKIIEAFQL